MPGMKMTNNLCFASLAILALLSLGCGEEPPTEPAAEQTEQTELTEEQLEEELEEPEQKAPEALAPSPHPIFEHWTEVLMAQSAPEACYAYKQGEPLPEEEQKEMDEIRSKALIALEAGKALYSARRAIFREALNMPGCILLEGYEDEERELRAGQLLAPVETLLAEGFRRDLEALGFCDGWLEPGCVEPGLRPGRQELLFRPELETLAFEQVDGCTPEIDWGYASLNETWRKRQNAVLTHLLDVYGGGNISFDELADHAPITASRWQRDDEDKATPATEQFREAMQGRLRREQQAWQLYEDAMQALVSPSKGYRGTGSSIFVGLYTPHLLDSRERFICMLTAGFDDMHKLFRLPRERSAELHPLHRSYSYGEIFTADATLFRHPKMPGNPWCIRFDGEGAGFIFVNDSPALRRYAEEHPEGGSAEVQGYQTIDILGSPYPAPEEDKYGERRPQPRPEGALTPWQIFNMLDCVVIEEYVPSEDKEDAAGEEAEEEDERPQPMHCG